MPENILILADWRLAGIVDDTMPSRDPNGDDDEEQENEEQDEDGNGQPPVVREPDPDDPSRGAPVRARGSALVLAQSRVMNRKRSPNAS
jgi:hypothetical protein